MLVDDARGLGELGLAIALVGDDDAVLHIALGGDDDEQDALFGEAQELDLAEGCRAPGSHHQAREIGEVGQQMRSGGYELLPVVDLKLAFELVNFYAI
jgi:hypothetical protein